MTVWRQLFLKPSAPVRVDDPLAFAPCNRRSRAFQTLWLRRRSTARRPCGKDLTLADRKASPRFCCGMGFFFAFTCVIVELACTFGLDVDLYNNSQKELAVTHTTRIGIRTKIVPTREVLKIIGNHFEVRRGGCTDSYSLPIRPPLEYLERGSPNLLAKVQFEEDGRIWILRTEDRAPISTGSYSQPPGFPLSPTSMCESTE